MRMSHRTVTTLILVVYQGALSFLWPAGPAQLTLYRQIALP